MLMLSEILIAVALLSLFPESSWRFLFKANHLFPFPLKMDPSATERRLVIMTLSTWVSVDSVSGEYPPSRAYHMEVDGFELSLLICAIMLGALARKKGFLFANFSSLRPLKVPLASNEAAESNCFCTNWCQIHNLLSFNHNLQPESIGHSPGWLKVNKAADQEESQKKFSAQLGSAYITMQKSICPTRISTAGKNCFPKNWCHI